MDAISSSRPGFASLADATASTRSNSALKLPAQRTREQRPDSVHLSISAEALARLSSETAQPKMTALEDQDAAKAQMLAYRNAAAQRDSARIDMDHPLFTDPRTADSALSVSALIGLAAPENARAVEDAVYAAISSPLQQWNDSTQAADIASQRMKLDAIKEQLLPEESRAHAGEVIDRYIGGLVEQRDRFATQLFEQSKALQLSLGNTAGAADTDEILRQLAQGNYKSQQEMAQALNVAGSLDFSSKESLGRTSNAAFAALRDMVQASMPGMPAQHAAHWTDQVESLRQNWQSFEQSLTQSATATSTVPQEG